MRINALEFAYRAVCTTRSDINQHCPRLFELAVGCAHVTELGTRTARSTTALAYAAPAELVCYDLVIHPAAVRLKQLVDAHGKTRMSLVQGNSLEITIEETDMLFIDTLHTRAQLAAELARHAGKVQHTIVMHDTETFADYDERTREPGGLRIAVSDFLMQNPAWKTAAHYTNNNGLTVLRRI